MTKDINVRVNTTAEQAAAELDAFKRKVQSTGQTTEQANRQAGTSTEQATQKMGAMGRMLGTLKTQVLGYVGAFLGLQGVMRIIDAVISGLQRIRDVQREIYDQSLSLRELGQQLEFQTGTVGQADTWGHKITEIHEAGGLKDDATAAQLLISADLAFGDVVNDEGLGGIENPEVIDMLKRIAPYLGMAQYDAGNIATIFGLAKTIELDPTIESYERYVAQVHAAYTEADSTNPGAFLGGLQRASTTYRVGGGTFEEGAGLYAGAVSVLGIGGETPAAELVKQIGRISGGANEQARLAIEQGQGVQWSELSGDQRRQAVLNYIASIPEDRQVATLVQQGFPGETVQNMIALTRPGYSETMSDALAAVTSATSESDRPAADAWMESDVSLQHQVEARSSRRNLGQDPHVRTWLRRLEEATNKMNIRTNANEGSILLFEEREALGIAFESLIHDLESLGELEGEDERIRQRALADARPGTSGFFQFLFPVAAMTDIGMNIEQTLHGLNQRTEPETEDAEMAMPAAETESQPAAQTPVITSITYSNDTHYHPHVDPHVGSGQPGAAVVDPGSFQ